MFLSTLMLSLSCSLDAFGIGITYGIKKILFSNPSKFIFFIITLVITAISVLLGDIIKNFIPDNLSKIVGAYLIIGIGLFSIIKNIIGSTSNYKSFDLDNSNNIDSREALLLSLALACDNLCIGISGNFFGINNYLFPFLVAFLQLVCLMLGSIFGKNLSSITSIPNKTWTIISGIILVLIGFIRLS